MESTSFETDLHWRDVYPIMRQHGFVDRNIDLQGVYSRAKNTLVKQGFKITSEEIQVGYWDLQARKSGSLRIATGTVRDVDLIIAGNGNKFSIQLRAGIWGRDFLVPAIEGVATFGVAAAAELHSARDFEEELWEEIVHMIDPSLLVCDLDGRVFESERMLQEHMLTHSRRDKVNAEQAFGSAGF